MKTLKLYIFIAVISLCFIFSACENNDFKKSAEILLIYNASDSTFCINYGTLSRRYDYFMSDTLSKYSQSYHRFYESEFNGPWMTEAEYNKYLKEITMYHVVGHDTFVVDKKFYDTIDKWDHRIPGSYAYMATDTVILTESFVVENYMFVKK